MRSIETYMAEGAAAKRADEAEAKLAKIEEARRRWQAAFTAFEAMDAKLNMRRVLEEVFDDA